MRRILLVPLRLIGSAIRVVLIGILSVAMIAGGVAFADYAVTQGVGTNFASKVITSVHYMAMVICDATAGESQCATVDSSGNLHVAAAGTASGTSISGLTGSPIQCQGVSAEPTPVSNGQMQWPQCGLSGKTISLLFANKENVTGQTVAFGAGTAQTVVTAGAGSLKGYLTDWACYNNSSTAITVVLNDTLSTTIFLPANGGNNKSWFLPLVSTAAATAITATPSTSNSNAGCTVHAYFGL